jgi:hypothetical protein
VVSPAKIGSIVPLGRGYSPHDPSTSCPATIVLSLREKIHSTAEALLDRAKEHRLEAYATLLSGVSSDLWKCFLTGVPRTPASTRRYIVLF